MAYKKHIWQTGEIITADKLNNIQNGIVNVFDNIPVINLADSDSSTLRIKGYGFNENGELQELLESNHSYDESKKWRIYLQNGGYINIEGDHIVGIYIVDNINNFGDFCKIKEFEGIYFPTSIVEYNVSPVVEPSGTYSSVYTFKDSGKIKIYTFGLSGQLMVIEKPLEIIYLQGNEAS